MSISCTTELLASRIAAFDAELSKRHPRMFSKQSARQSPTLFATTSAAERSALARLRRPSHFQTRAVGICHCTTCSSAAPW